MGVENVGKYRLFLQQVNNMHGGLLIWNQCREEECPLLPNGVEREGQGWMPRGRASCGVLGKLDFFDRKQMQPKADKSSLIVSVILTPTAVHAK